MQRLLSLPVIVLAGPVLGMPPVLEPPKPRTTADVWNEAAVRQDQLNRQFEEWRRDLLLLTKRLEQHPNPTSRELARQVTDALNQSADRGLVARLVAVSYRIKREVGHPTLEGLEACLDRLDEARVELRALREQLPVGLKDQRLVELVRRLVVLEDEMHRQQDYFLRLQGLPRRALQGLDPKEP
jgi:hypothetical protein